MTFVDANVLLEVIQQRARKDICEQFLASGEDKAISMLSLDLVMYFVERDKLPWEPIRNFLESFAWLPMIDADAQWAFMNFKGDDFEDALQVACAIREGCDSFATLDGPLYEKYEQILNVNLIR